jgi:DNA-binding response OmpR family regulator
MLIVEDERDMAQVLKEGLEEENHLVSKLEEGSVFRVQIPLFEHGQR